MQVLTEHGFACVVVADTMAGGGVQRLVCFGGSTGGGQW